MAIGDCTCQCIQHRLVKKQQQQLDWGRTAKFAVIGLTLHGPYFFKGFELLDAKFGTAATFRNAITKSLVGQVTLFPTYTSLFLMYASLLVDGSTWEQGVSRVKQRLPGLLVTGSAYWPVVNMLNFKFLAPGNQRVLAVNVCAIVWNSYLSYISTTPVPSNSRVQGT